MLVDKSAQLLKTGSVVVNLKSLGRHFHSAEPANENACSANFVRSRGLE